MKEQEMLYKLHLHSLISSILLLPVLALNAHSADFSFNNSANYPVDQLSITASPMDNWKECILAGNTILDN
jgi:hypothetical protein